MTSETYDPFGDYEALEPLSLLDKVSQQDEYLREEYGPDILISRSSINSNIIRVFKPGGVANPKPYQIAEGEFKIVTFVDRWGMVVHEVTFLESSKFIEPVKKETKSFWDKFCFWR